MWPIQVHLHRYRYVIQYHQHSGQGNVTQIVKVNYKCASTGVTTYKFRRPFSCAEPGSKPKE